MRVLFVFLALVIVPFIYKNEATIIHKSHIEEKPISYMTAREAAEKEEGEYVEFVCFIKNVYTTTFAEKREGSPIFLNIKNPCNNPIVIRYFNKNSHEFNADLYKGKKILIKGIIDIHESEYCEMDMKAIELKKSEQIQILD